MLFKFRVTEFLDLSDLVDHYTFPFLIVILYLNS